ncbi:hypothetical protein ACHAWF_010077, partial [Thalassiosira exigua]
EEEEDAKKPPPRRGGRSSDPAPPPLRPPRVAGVRRPSGDPRRPLRRPDLVPPPPGGGGGGRRGRTRGPPLLPGHSRLSLSDRRRGGGDDRRRRGRPLRARGRPRGISRPLGPRGGSRGRRGGVERGDPGGRHGSGRRGGIGGDAARADAGGGVRVCAAGERWRGGGDEADAAPDRGPGRARREVGLGRHRGARRRDLRGRRRGRRVRRRALRSLRRAIHAGDERLRRRGGPESRPRLRRRNLPRILPRRLRRRVQVRRRGARRRRRRSRPRRRGDLGVSRRDLPRVEAVSGRARGVEASSQPRPPRSEVRKESRSFVGADAGLVRQGHHGRGGVAPRGRRAADLAERIEGPRRGNPPEVVRGSDGTAREEDAEAIPSFPVAKVGQGCRHRRVLRFQRRRPAGGVVRVRRRRVLPRDPLAVPHQGQVGRGGDVQAERRPPLLPRLTRGEDQVVVQDLPHGQQEETSLRGIDRRRPRLGRDDPSGRVRESAGLRGISMGAARRDGGRAQRRGRSGGHLAVRGDPTAVREGPAEAQVGRGAV